MSDAYLGEIRMFSGKYAPRDWELCNGQLLSVNEYQALFSLIGNKYGGDGVTNFALPDLRGRIPIHKSPEYPIASKGGVETVTLTEANLPAHTHIVTANNEKTETTESSPANNVWGVADLKNYQTSTTSDIVQMDSNLVSSVGGNQQHENVMPSLVINFIIATQGLYPYFS
ncbi:MULTISPECIES: phage tail protein [unclassified Lysinibacillus]|uniref:phage tail protein n=1 Tax=unclassified Lysinibacillus TaxID=2636778 RepID=UPI003808CD83